MILRWRIAAAQSVLSLFPSPPALLSLEIFQEIRSMFKDTAGLKVVGSNIYLALGDRRDISGFETQLGTFI
jgi:hypothetical protein